MSASRTKLPVLPEMQCDAGCTDCCGKPFAISESELVEVLAYANEHDVQPRRQGGLCPFYQDGRCAVYEARPLVCDLFGHLPEMSPGCTKGYNAPVDDPVPYRDELAAKGPRVRFMHEALGGPLFKLLPEWAPLLLRVDQDRMRLGLQPFTIATSITPPGGDPFVILTSNNASAA